MFLLRVGKGLASPKEVSQAQKRSRKPRRGLASPEEVSQARKRSRKPRRARNKRKRTNRRKGRNFEYHVSFRLWLVGTINIICCYVSPQGRQGVSQAQQRSRKPKRGLASPEELEIRGKGQPEGKGILSRNSIEYYNSFDGGQLRFTTSLPITNSQGLWSFKQI